MPSFADYKSAPKWVVLQLTEKCNLRCSMCYEWGDSGSYKNLPESAVLDFDVLTKVITDLTPHRPYFGLFGGEPMMYPRIEELLRLIHQSECGLDIPTNGLLLKEQAELLVETAPRRMWISLDGPQPINDQQRGKAVYRRVTAGMAALHEVRERRGSEWPKIGVTLIVTPINYQYVEQFFRDLLDELPLEHISIEFQNYATMGEYEAYCRVLNQEFEITSAPMASGVVQDPAAFADIDCDELARQILAVKQLCEQRDIYFIAYPKSILPENYRSYFSADWKEMADWKERCTFPWIYAEVSARGDVTSCHTFYDLTMGNVYNQSILEIWRNAAYERYRKHLRTNLFPTCTACSRYYRDPSKK